MTKTKLEKEYQIDDDKNVVVAVDALPEISETALKKKIKREMTEKQKANIDKVIQANKLKWAKQREDKEKAKKEAEDKLKQETQEKLISGTHVKVRVKEKKVFQRKPKALKEESSSDEITDVTETDVTDDDEDYEEYKSKKRVVRKEIKRNIKAIQKIDQVLTAQQQNPYLSSLMNRWK